MVASPVATASIAPARDPSLALKSDEWTPLLGSRVPPAPRGRPRLAVLLALAGRVWATVAQSETSQALQERGHFNKPFFIVCFNHTLTGLLVPLVLTYYHFFGPHKTDHGNASWVRDPVAALRRHSVLPLEQLVVIALFLSFFFLFVDYFWYAALTGVSVTVATAVGNSTPLFVYCFSICFLRERVTLPKVSGVLVALVGVTLVVVFQRPPDGTDLAREPHQDQGNHHSVLAALLVVVSSALCAGYDVAFKFLLGAELTDTATVLLLAGLSGLFTVPLWIVGTALVAHSPVASLYEPFDWPATGEGAALLVGSGLLAVLFNACTPLLLSWTTPLETSVGGMLVVPLSGVWDVAFHGTAFPPLCVVGAVLALVGFGVLEHAAQAATPPTGKSRVALP